MYRDKATLESGLHLLLIAKKDYLLVLVKYLEVNFVLELDIHMHQSMDVGLYTAKVKTKTCFVERIGLLNWRIDPLRDLNHI